MTEAKKILEMIEAVDPADTATMDEIDILVTEYATPNVFPIDQNGYPCTWEQQKAFLKRNGVNPAFPFTRSRDALKLIRPEGWLFEHKFTWPDCGVEFDCYAFHKKLGIETCVVTGLLQDRSLEAHAPTEELAELHAIIQAIAYDEGEMTKRITIRLTT